MVREERQFPYDYACLKRDLIRLQNENHIESLQFTSCGSSVMGRDIALIKLGTGKRRLHVNAAVHANEWITSAAVMRFVEMAATSFMEGEANHTIHGYDIRHLLERASLWIVPMANPDGVQLAIHGIQGQDEQDSDQLLAWNGQSSDFTNWKANIHGIDLNDQFPAHWEEEHARRSVPGPSMRDFPGERPLSEPEAQALYMLTLDGEFEAVVSLHTQGREIYWNYRDHEPPHAEDLARRLGEVSGYMPVKLTDSDAGYKDWFIQTFRRPGFTIESGWGCNPLPFDQLDEISEEVAKILLEAASYVAAL